MGWWVRSNLKATCISVLVANCSQPTGSTWELVDFSTWNGFLGGLGSGNPTEKMQEKKSDLQGGPRVDGCKWSYKSYKCWSYRRGTPINSTYNLVGGPPCRNYNYFPTYIFPREGNKAYCSKWGSFQPSWFRNPLEINRNWNHFISCPTKVCNMMLFF